MQQRVWEAIATSWNAHRQKPWKEVIQFSRDKKTLLDLGCGSGRNFLRGKKYVGVDFSGEMLRLAKQNAKKKGTKVRLIRADVSSLPLESNKFDNVIFTAVLHVMTRKKRDKCLKEARRVMTKGGSMLVTVWNKKQPRFSGSKKVVFVPWTANGRKYMRYYYLFTKDELKRLLSKYFEVEYIESTTRSRLSGENIVAVVKKI